MTPDAATNGSAAKVGTKRKAECEADASADVHRPASPTLRKADVLGRLASTKSAGRGAVAGWTPCPLCHHEGGVTKSHKVFAAGRGLAAHLHAVHPPWQPPSKAEVRRRSRKRQRQAHRAASPASHIDSTIDATNATTTGWEPTAVERQAWDARVLALVQQAEAAMDTSGTATVVHRNGQPALTYRASLPPLIQAAADGQLAALQQALGGASAELLHTRDRHGSTAEHWAAGNGHLPCLQFLVEQRRIPPQPPNGPPGLLPGQPPPVVGATTSTDVPASKKVRRRDGKTPLHYAARNGQMDCARYLLEKAQAGVNAVSGDGTTPLHMACYGGQEAMVHFLVNEAGAELATQNAWGCSPAHWVAMSRTEDTDALLRLARWLQEKGVAFAQIQAQGHSPLHKAAQHKNRAFIQWLAEGLSVAAKSEAAEPDHGGHAPWDIWESAGGDAAFAAWMKQEFAPRTPTSERRDEEKSMEKSST